MCEREVDERCNDEVCRACHETESLEDCLGDKQLRAMFGDSYIDGVRGLGPYVPPPARKPK